MKLQPYQKGIAAGVGIAGLIGLAILGGVWVLIVGLLCLLVGCALGVVVGIEVARRDTSEEMTTLRTHYAAAEKLVNNLQADNAALYSRAVDAEQNLLAVTREKTQLRAKLDQRQADGAA
ncbi:hypothetical protein ACOZ38_25470 [Sphaerisporangium viridialbum]|uniref:hypothetical protein n=1 Tax=Sphaerisporangium viridialbum TaxID=46189 RepID=UPI003C737A08